MLEICLRGGDDIQYILSNKHTVQIGFNCMTLVNETMQDNGQYSLKTLHTQNKAGNLKPTVSSKEPEGPTDGQRFTLTNSWK